MNENNVNENGKVVYNVDSNIVENEIANQKQELTIFIQSIESVPLLEYLIGIKNRLEEKWGY